MEWVGIILEKVLGLRLKGYVQHSDRIILLKMNEKLSNTVIIQTYIASTDADDKVEKVYELPNESENSWR